MRHARQRARRGGSRRLSFLVLGVGLLGGLRGASDALARSPAKLSATDAPEALIAEGVARRERGEDEAALSSFQRAHGLCHCPRALAQVALAEQALGRWVDAQDQLSQALSHAEDPWIVAKRPLLEQALAEIADHVGWLALSGGVPGAVVSIGGSAVGVLPLARPLRVLAGVAALRVQAPGYASIERAITVPARGVAREVLVMSPLTPVVAAAPSARDGLGSTRGPPAPIAAGAVSDSNRWTPRRTAAFALTAGAAAGLAIGITSAVIGRERRAAFNASTDDVDHLPCTTADLVGSCRGLRDRVQSAQAWMVGGFAAAAVLGGLGAYLFLSGPAPGTATAAAMPTAPARWRPVSGVRCGPTGVIGETTIACVASF